MMRSGSRGVGDDEEDLQAGQDDLFGRSTAAPINLADDGAGDGAAANVAGAADEETVSTGAKRNRPSASDVWDDYEKIFKVVSGKRIRFQAKCIHCGRVYAAQSPFGTGSLLRHRGKCPVKNRKSNLGQSVIQFNSDGSVGTWEYSADVVRTQLL